MVYTKLQTWLAVLKLFFFWLQKNADLYSKCVTFPKIMLLLKVSTTKWLVSI